MNKAYSFSLPFIKKKLLTKDTYSFLFDKSNLKNFDFTPGQYIRLNLPHNNPDSRGTSRFFTISSSPLDPYLIITTRILKSSFKKTLYELRLNQTVSFFGPMGNFILPNTNKPVFFISEGIGITPFYSILLYTSQKKLSSPITLIAFFVNKKTYIFYSQIQNITKQNSSLKTYFKPTKIDLVRKIIQEEKSIDLNSRLYYISGRSSFLEKVAEVLNRLGIANSQIKIDDFIGY